jgi:hypothetical protein
MLPPTIFDWILLLAFGKKLPMFFVFKLERTSKVCRYKLRPEIKNTEWMKTFKVQQKNLNDRTTEKTVDFTTFKVRKKILKHLI